MKYAVDRIEENIVVLENISSGEIVNEDIKKLPKNIKEGNILIKENDKYTLDLDTEKDRREDFRSRLERLKNLKKQFMEKIKEIDGDDLDNVLLSDLVVEGYYDYFEITNCIINKCDFSKSNLQGIDISDTKISFSNFSNVDLSSRSYKKTNFDDCNLVGIDFNSSFLEDVIFNKCNLSYCNFSGCNLKNVKFIDCKLDDGSFNEIKWKSLEFNNCSMESVEFIHTKLKDIDLSNCNIKDLRVPVESLKGLIVSYDQALGLSLLLGIKIKQLIEINLNL